jgi:hypothetical protein
MQLDPILGLAALRSLSIIESSGRWIAIPAAELLPDVLDHLPGFRDDLQRLGDVLDNLMLRRFG